jgi:hypothetical protein
MNKLTFDQLLEVFGKEEVTSILESKLVEEQNNYNWLRTNYERKKDYFNFRALDKRTPITKVYFDLKGQLFDYEELPKLEIASKRLNRLAFQYLQATGGMPLRNDNFMDEMRLEQIRQTPIESLYEGTLRGSTKLQGLCPFHNERTPSFVIYTDTNSFHCFGCQKHGAGAVDYLMLNEGLDFKDAVRRLS